MSQKCYISTVTSLFTKLTLKTKETFYDSLQKSNTEAAFQKCSYKIVF